ncbi:MAG: amylo-alpha-1,6-glucosidase, partial [Alistipes sp.]|nr:amylo-alpha-1,6-glucosidase [Alistipes sp.]
PYKMIDSAMQLGVILTVRQHLLTPRGLRTLSPRNPLYRGSQEGTPAERDFAGKNGSVWPWLISFYVRACFGIDGGRFLPQAEEILENFNEDIQSYGIGSISELNDADPPFASRGAISQAWSVAALLDISAMIHSFAAAEPARKSAPRKAAARKTAGDKPEAAKKPAAKKTGKKTK